MSSSSFGPGGDPVLPPAFAMPSQICTIDAASPPYRDRADRSAPERDDVRSASVAQLAFDQDVAKRLEFHYRTRDVLRRRQLVHDALAAAPGERVLDLGCGPGFYLAELSERVRPTGAVIGIDKSPQVLDLARSRCTASNVSFHEAEAGALPVPDASCDAALSVQVFEYLEDPALGLAELHRVLRPGGRVVLWDVDWGTVSWFSRDPARMRRVLDAWDQHLAHPSLPQTLAARLRERGFDDVRCEGHVFASTELVPDAYAGLVFEFVERYVRGTTHVDPAAVDAWAAEQHALHERGEFFFTCTQFCFCAKRS